MGHARKLTMNSAGLTVATVILAACINPQQSCAGDAKGELLKRGSGAVVFGISERLSLSSFDGMTFAVKLLYRDLRAIRGGVTFGSADGIKHNDRIALTHLVHMSAEHQLSPYWGIGPSVEYAGRSTDNELAFGLDLIVGAEWFPKPQLGMYAEYGTALIYRTLRGKEDWSVEERRSDSYEVVSDGVRWGLSLNW